MLPLVDVSVMSSPASISPPIDSASTLVRLTSVPAVKSCIATNVVAASAVMLPIVAVTGAVRWMLAVVEVSVTLLVAVIAPEESIPATAFTIISVPAVNVSVDE